MQEEPQVDKVAILLEALKVGILPSEIEHVKSTEPPGNCLFEIGNDRSPKAVNLMHVKTHRGILVEVGIKFLGHNHGIPNKVECRNALALFDTFHAGKLSHARTRKLKGEFIARKSDQHEWAKDNGDSLAKLLAWFKKLRNNHEKG